MISMLKKLIWKLTWRRKLCGDCVYNYAFGNNTPCHGECKEGSCFERFEGAMGNAWDQVRYHPPLEAHMRPCNPCVVEHEGYTAMQLCVVEYLVTIFKKDKVVWCVPSNRVCTESELKEMITDYIEFGEKARAAFEEYSHDYVKELLEDET